MAVLQAGGTGIWGAGIGLRNIVLAAIGALAALALVLFAMLAERADDWRTRGEPQRLPRDLPVAATPPRPLGNPARFFDPDDYPVEALRQNWEGLSRVALLVDDEGQPTACEVVESSGHSILDRTTCRLAVQHARFTPARDRQGRAMIGVYRTFNVRWQMPTDT